MAPLPDGGLVRFEAIPPPSTLELELQRLRSLVRELRAEQAQANLEILHLRRWRVLLLWLVLGLALFGFWLAGRSAPDLR